MATNISTALAKVEKAAAQIFDADSTVRSVGVGKVSQDYGFIAVRNLMAPVPFHALIGGSTIPTTIDGIAVEYIGSHMDPTQLVAVPRSGPGGPGDGSVICEQQYHRPLVCGLQIQNFDDDERTTSLGCGYIVVGTLGCFVRMRNGDIALMSNNHVAAGENRGVRGQDRILQPGNITFVTAEHVSALTEFEDLIPSVAGASIASGTVLFNDVDAGVASLIDGVGYSQSYLPSRSVKGPHGVAAATVGDVVYKVGRTTGLTHGTITQVAVVVGPIMYAPGPCWFRLSFVIEGIDGTTFSHHGDSGSLIVRQDGMAVGLLYAGNGIQTYACEIGHVFHALNCRLA